jgi:hypothetical protein
VSIFLVLFAETIRIEGTWIAEILRIVVEGIHRDYHWSPYFDLKPSS